jgi:hypothetical protein
LDLAADLRTKKSRDFWERKKHDGNLEIYGIYGEI